MRFWDSSALVPLLVAEPRTEGQQALLRDDPVVVVWWSSEVACTSAIARLERDAALDESGVREALTRLRSLAAAWNEVEPRQLVRETAQRLLRVHTLGAADALQLAAASVASGFRPTSLELVCLDARLRRAAVREGFGLLPVPEP